MRIRIVDDNADAFLKDFDEIGGALTRPIHFAEMGNDARDEHGNDYPAILDAAEGYDVLNDEEWLTRTTETLDRMLQAGEPLTDATIRQALGEAAEATIRFLQSYTAETAPSLVPGGPRRPKHPTNLADRTRRLVNAYHASVDGGEVKRYPVAGAGFRAFDDGGTPF